MVVWGYPCESKSSPAFKSKTPRSLTRAGCFFMCGVDGLNEIEICARKYKGSILENRASFNRQKRYLSCLRACFNAVLKPSSKVG